MKAIILAAGSGLRLNGKSGGMPKCLLELGGLTLIERQVRILRSLGISEIVPVVGYEGALVREICGPQHSYVTNDQFATTNSLFSLWRAREHMQDGFVVLNSDVLFDERMLAALLASPHDDALLFEPAENGAPRLGDEEMKVRISDGRVVEISKRMDPAIADGENVGIVKFGPAGATLLIEHMDQLLSRGELNAWAPRAFQAFAADRPLFAISTNGLAWIEIDFPEDYKRAQTEILPKIRRVAPEQGTHDASKLPSNL